jgi:hypothetical protein
MGLFVPLYGSFRAYLKRVVLVPVHGPDLGPNPARYNGSCRAWAVLLSVLRAGPSGPAQMYTYSADVQSAGRRDGRVQLAEPARRRRLRTGVQRAPRGHRRGYRREASEQGRSPGQRRVPRRGVDAQPPAPPEPRQAAGLQH